MPTDDASAPTLYCERAGSGPPLVLIAGYACDLSLWGLVRPRLARDFSLLMFDHRGVGRSPDPDGPHPVRRMAEDVADLMAQCGLARAHVLGHSLGAAVAQELAARRPELVDRLVLANPLIRFRAGPAEAFRELLRRREMGEPMRALVERVLPWIYSRAFLANRETTRLLVEAVLAYPFPQSLAGQRAQLDALVAFDSSPWFSTITAPTLVVTGVEDGCCSPEDGERLAAGIAGARLVRMPGQAHAPLVETPAEFAEIVGDFLRGA